MSLCRHDHLTRPVKADSSNVPTRINSSELFQGQNRLVIVHNSSEYQLQITRLGKLILTK
ncbi:MAG: hemin uptake protein HemP [Candidatus Thiodiazotropha endolucinida]|nr:hemin uptake protein HemP [Candidatus Thiodiazotropha sp. (ex Lucina pensylvanica)]MBT3038316.1 hemin uptake protein HemP [Candidatus Thiodiazotropha sp. (ex Codakia orbicularis)]MBT3042139.1 hemin uptake protein HemP [Candidatus Thiodiazotropha sp. (ex Codakia orbicularis)]MBV2124518.1 hemin uptake protein HemP [Candidatus Thiodiazotropha taylori]